jgi:hypothetical protein
VDNASALPTVPQAEQNQKKQTSDVLPKPDKLIRYRQAAGWHSQRVRVRLAVKQHSMRAHDKQFAQIAIAHL